MPVLRKIDLQSQSELAKFNQTEQTTMLRPSIKSNTREHVRKIHKFKHKRTVKKPPRRSTPKQVREQMYCQDDKTCENSPQATHHYDPAWPRRRCRICSLHLLQGLVVKAGYRKLTYLVSLQILCSLEFEGSMKVCYKAAGTALLMAAKLHQTRQVRIKDLLEWSFFTLDRSQILETEARVMIGYGYQLPLYQYLEESAIQEECISLQRQLYFSS